MAAFMVSFFLWPRPMRAGETAALIDPEGVPTEQALEALLAPGEFPGRRFEYTSEGEEALFSLDSSLSASEPFAAIHPERLVWPRIADLELKIIGQDLRLTPASGQVDDDMLDWGFVVRWILAPLGQRFEPIAHFAAKVVRVEVLSARDRKPLLLWTEPPKEQVCREKVEAGRPNCRFPGISREVRAAALSPDGNLLALAIGGIRPRIEMYELGSGLRLSWQALFKKDSGGAVEVAFSGDQQWVVALTGKGRMHRFDAVGGGRHLPIPSAGRTARTVPPGPPWRWRGRKGR